MTNQEIFDTAITGLLAQGAYGYSDGGCDYYDHATGNRCAVGLLLPVETAKRWAYDLGVSSIGNLDYKIDRIKAEVMRDLDALGITDEQIEFLDCLQALHDSLAVGDFNRDRFLEAAREFANIHGLRMPA